MIKGFCFRSNFHQLFVGVGEFIIYGIGVSLFIAIVYNPPVIYWAALGLGRGFIFLR